VKKQPKVKLITEDLWRVQEASHVASITTDITGSEVRDALGVLWRWGGGQASDDECLQACEWLRQEHFMTQQVTGWTVEDTDRRMLAATAHAAHLAGRVALGQTSTESVAMVTTHAVRLRDARGGLLGALTPARAEVGRVRALYVQENSPHHQPVVG